MAASASAQRISVTAEVVGTGSDGTEPSLLLSVQRHGVYSADVTVLKRYLFNCGEGTQRLSGENGIKLSSLDAMYFTRFDIKSVSGVPGVIFALGSCGSATLRLHGPPGLRGFLGAIRSFVRRKYPQIQCVEVTKGEESAHNEPEHGNAGSEERASFGYETWPEGDEQHDQHARIIPVTLRTKASDFPCGDDQQNICLLCSKAAPTGQSRNPTEEANKDSETPSRSIDALRSGQIGRRQTQESDEHKVWRAWLSRYYAIKAPEKAPYIEVVLNRYRGRYDDLKVQLCAKYGDMDDKDASAAASASSSSSSDSEDSDDSDDGIVNYEQQPLDRKWLQTFYAEHQPDKLPHVDKVLKQFSSREETLKQMLLSKYGQGSSAKRTSETKTDASAAKNTASNKKRKLLASAEEESKTMVQEDEPAKIFVDDASVATTTESPILQDAAGSLCYIVQFQYAPFPTVWVIDCCSMEHIDSLINRFAASIETSRGGCCGAHLPSLVVHLSPQHVRGQLRYTEWMASLHSSEHLVFDGEALQSVAEGAFSFAFLSSAKSTMQKYAESRSSTDKNGQLGSSVPSLIRGLSQFLDDASWSVASPCQRQIVRRLEGSERNVHFAQSKLQFRLMHSKGLQLGFSYERTGWRRRADKEADGEDGEAKPEAKQMHTPPELPYAPEYTVARRMLIVLGTGSAAPSKLRASSGMYLELSGSGAAEVASMLVDCGEGTYGQLWRQFGREVTQRIGGLRCIWISHNHADHHCGLVRVLYEYWRFHTHHSGGKTPPPLVVVGPQSVLSYVKSWLPEFGGNMPTSQLFQLATCSEFNRSDHPLRRQLLSDIGFAATSIISVPVFHCYDSYGLVLTLQGGKKLVYSGDTKPCNQLVVAGMNAALLVHEATFDDTMEQDARLKKHSTVGQAMDIARRMKAQQLVLTHFSQRYPALPPPVATPSSSDGITTGANPSGREMKVLCAFDGFVHPMPF